MATRGFEDWTEADIAKMSRERRGQRFEARPVGTTGIEVRLAKSKYRNVRTIVGDEKFDSKREGDYWLLLKAREQLGEIRELRRQVAFALYAPSLADPGVNVEVSEYRADYHYFDNDAVAAEHVVDAKGKRTRMYLLKKKWLELQSGIEIEEV